MSARTGFGFGIALGVFALTAIAACAAVAGARHHRARREERQRLETWEGEGGSLSGETPAGTPSTAVASSAAS